MAPVPVRLGQNWTGPVVGEVTALEEDERGVTATMHIHDPAAVERYFGMEPGEFGNVSGISLGFVTTPVDRPTHEEGEL